MVDDLRATTQRLRIMLLLAMVAVGLVLTGLAGFVLVRRSGPAAGGDLYQMPAFLPDGFGAERVGGCVISDAAGPVGTMLVFGDDGRRRSDTREAAAAIRVSVWDTTRSSPDTGAPVTEATLLAQADPGSIYQIDLDGRNATGYEISTAEPVPMAWPALVWTGNDRLVWLFGEGITSLELFEVADSLAGVSAAEFDEAVTIDLCRPSPGATVPVDPDLMAPSTVPTPVGSDPAPAPPATPPATAPPATAPPASATRG